MTATSSPPRLVRPMWLHEERQAFAREGWGFEIKYDGFRALALTGDRQPLLYSRRLRDLAPSYPRIVDALAGLPPGLHLDGEVVVLDQDGRPDFQALREYRKAGSADLRYFAFDVLRVDGRDVTGLPLLERKSLLKDVLADQVHSPLQYVDYLERDGRLFFEAVKAQGLEGMVAKKADSPYRPDDGTPATRKREWVKVKAYVRHGWDETVYR